MRRMRSSQGDHDGHNDRHHDGCDHGVIRERLPEAGVCEDSHQIE